MSDPVDSAPASEHAASTGGSPLDAITEHPFVQQHPEALVGAAFAGAFVFAKVLKALGGSDD